MNRLTVILISALVLLLGIVFTQQKRITTLKESSRAGYEYLDIKNDTPTYYLNDLGMEVAKRKALETEVSNIRKLRESDNLKFIEYFSSIDKKLRNLKSATNTESIIERSVQTVIKDSIVIDSVYYRGVEFKDEWIDFKGYKDNDSDSVMFSFQIPVPISYVVLKDKSRVKILGKYRKLPWNSKKRINIEATSKNPYVKITELEHIRVKD